MALIDASMKMGDRPLFLHMPYFRGRDVEDMQAALSSMGFSCTADSVFSPETEQALRDFQENMGLEVTGILDESSLRAILRLKHVWEGKRGLSYEWYTPETARSIQALEQASLCVFGIDEATRSIANQVANLARATTSESGIVSVSSLGKSPSKGMLLVGLEILREADKEAFPDEERKTLRVKMSRDAKFEEELAKAIDVARGSDKRLTLVISATVIEGRDTRIENQEIATFVLDALCKALA